MGERHVALECTGVPHEYAAVLTTYADLLPDQSSRIEALKRATFLVWYAIAEPAEFTGLWAVTPAHERRVVTELERELASTGGDAELRAMLTWYVRVMGGAPFNHYPEHTRLAKFVEVVEVADEEPFPWRPTITANRGQMGRYWESLRHDA
jgi:hypothetical protein